MKTKEQLVSLGLTEIKADEVMLLESKMLEQAVKFQFRKKDGSIRDAIGTRKRELMVQEDGKVWEPVGAQKPECPTTLGFWDLEKKAWRSLIVSNLVAVEG